MLRRIGLALALVSAPHCAWAETQPRLVGGWIVKSDRDPFSDGKTSIAVASSGSDRLALRCFSGRLSTVLILPTNKRDFAEGQSVDYQYRSDNGAIYKETGTVFGDFNVELSNAGQILRDAGVSKQLAFRVTFPGGEERTLTFSSKNGWAALSTIRSECEGSGRPPTLAAAPSKISPPAPQSPPALDGDRVDEDTIEKLRKQIIQDAGDAIAYVMGCEAIEINNNRLAMAIILSDAGSADEAVASLKTAANTARVDLVKDPSRNLCAEAWVLYGPLGSRTRQLVMQKPPAEEAAAK